MTAPLILDVEQGTPEWLQARTGLLTGSRASDAIGVLKSGKESAARRDYRIQLVSERLTGRPQEDTFVNAAMQHGTDTEPAARGAYEAITGQLIRQTGFIQRPDVLAGCSLDGHVGSLEGILELKCPKTATHLGYLLRPHELPKRYIPQVTHNLWVTGATWCDFVSFDDRLPEPMQLFAVRVRAEELGVETYAEKALAFLAEVDAELAKLQEQFADVLVKRANSRAVKFLLDEIRVDTDG